MMYIRGLHSTDDFKANVKITGKTWRIFGFHTNQLALKKNSEVKLPS